MSNQNKNFLYNIIYQVFIFIIPLVTTPYISRVLGVNNVGIYSYTYSIVYYFMLASMLGISNYGAREIAKCKSTSDTTKTFKSLHALQLSLNIFMLIAYVLFVQFSNYEYKTEMFIQTIFLVSVAFDINWFYFGKEEFKITVSRNIIIKLLSLIFIFTFVKTENDLGIYTVIMSVSTLISQLYLWIFLNKYLDKTKISIKDIFPHIKPCLLLFIPVIAYSVYRVMDKTMIGYFSSTIELGNYDSAEKIINIPLSIITALGTVMMPHMAKKNHNEVKTEISKTFELTLFVVAPMIVGLLIISSDFSIIFFGSEYEKTGGIIKLLSITVLFSSIANVIRTSFLIPLNKDKIYITSTVVGACVNLILNLIFIKKYGAYGACIGTIFAEFAVMIYQVIRTKKDLNYNNVVKLLMIYFSKSMIMGIIIFGVGMLFNILITKLIFQLILGITVYAIMNINYIKKDFFGRV